MDYKKTKAANTTITRYLEELERITGNVYEAISIVSKRADQISVELKKELNQKLEEFASYTDNLEEVFENREQIEISKFYEKLPKPTLIALEELNTDQIYFRKPQASDVE
ncbi:MAG: DNA-directed RNA polymerase subunit omega [Bacteroidales bacterium]|nr:DNA-directed RNA polymerase subunit omega [Bacteroidales bacterium]